ncbi:MAG: tyrosine-type recombinase/integrase [Lachnospiraceae bacterium]|nr:tyrosine-type recombinase/integrase [Lachnospiraceae bacterium]
MEELRIIDLSLRVLDAIRTRNLKEKSIKEFERYGVRRILSFFSTNGWVFYSKEKVWDFVLQERLRMESGHLPDYQWRDTRRAAVYFEQMVGQGYIQEYALPKWEAEHNRLFLPVSQEESPSLQMETLICQVRDAIMALDMTDKAKQNYIYCGLGSVLKYFDDHGKKTFQQELLDAAIADAWKRYDAGEIKQATWKIRRKAALWIGEFKRTGKISHCKVSKTYLVPISPGFEMLIREYDAAIRAEGYLKERTCTAYTTVIRGFFRRMDSLGQHDYARLSLCHITDCVSKTAKETPLGIFNTMVAMRSFTQFISDTHPELPDISAALICTPAKRRRVYEGYSDHEAKAILAAIDRDSVKGKRDFAMVMLAYSTGLRGCDIVNLKFNSIDWGSEEIRIIQEKTDTPLALPLDIATGNAIADYILNGRPTCDSEYVFLRIQRPYTKLVSMGCMVTEYAHKALGPARKTNGPHSFRRGMGRRLLEAGVPSSVICDVLGHTSADSLRQYTASSLDGLKQCARTLESIPVMQEELL